MNLLVRFHELKRISFQTPGTSSQVGEASRTAPSPPPPTVPPGGTPSPDANAGLPIRAGQSASRALPTPEPVHPTTVY